VFDGDPVTSRKKGTPTLTQFLAHVYYCGQMAGWMNTPLGTEVDLGTVHIVLGLVPAVRKRGTAAPPLFAHVYCGHGRPSQLLLSSCFKLNRALRAPGVLCNILTESGRNYGTETTLFWHT